MVIEVLVDHSYEDDYFQIDRVFVKLKDPAEAKRVREKVKELGLEGSLVDPGRLSARLAKALEVDVKLIDIDTNEIDI